MILFTAYSTVVIQHDITAAGRDEAMEAAWQWSQSLPGNYEVLDHSINYRHEVK